MALGPEKWQETMAAEDKIQLVLEDYDSEEEEDDQEDENNEEQGVNSS